MKTKFLCLTAFLILIFSHSFAQYDIEYDFDKKTIKMPDGLKKMKQDDFYKIIVSGINLNVYRVTMNSKDSASYSAIDFSSMLSSGGGLSGVFSGINETLKSLIGRVTPEIGDPVIEFEKEKNLNERLLEISKRGKEYSDSIALYESKVNLRLQKAMLIDLKASEIIDLKFVSEAKSNYESIGKKITILKSDFEPLSKEVDDTLAKYKDKTEHEEKMKALKKVRDDLSASTSKLEANSHETYRNKLTAKLYDYLNNSSTTYTSLPIQLTKDQVSISLKIEPIDTASRLPSYYSNLSIPGRQNMYWAIGPSIYYSGLYDERYSQRGYQENDSTAYYQIIQEHDTKADDSSKVTGANEFGAAINLKVGGRIPACPSWGIHGSIGSGFSFTKTVRPRLMVGGGMSWGYKHRLTLDGGVIMGNTERLSKAYKLTDTLPEAAEVVTVSKFQKSFYVSVGYVFTL